MSKIAVFLTDGRILYFDKVETVIMQAPGERVEPRSGAIVLSPHTTVSWMRIDAMQPVLSPPETDSANGSAVELRE